MADYPAAGSTLGPFRIVRRLGGGAMGVVFLAEEQELDREVALKIISPELAEDSGFRERFTREARSQARLNSGHVVQVYRYGEQDGCLFIATQLVPDGDLGALLTQYGPPLLPNAVELIAQVAEGVADAHDAGLIHRDIKTANILVRRRTEGLTAYVADFGIARTADSHQTKTGVAVGTPSYMAPELHLGQQATVRSDIYSLGCLMWATLTGHPPYSGTTEFQVIRSHMDADVRQLDGGGPVIEETNRILRIAMAKSPQDRYSSAGGMRADLLRLVTMAERGSVPPVVPLEPGRPSGGPGAAAGSGSGAGLGSGPGSGPGSGQGPVGSGSGGYGSGGYGSGGYAGAGASGGSGGYGGSGGSGGSGGLAGSGAGSGPVGGLGSGSSRAGSSGAGSSGAGSSGAGSSGAGSGSGSAGSGPRGFGGFGAPGGSGGVTVGAGSGSAYPSGGDRGPARDQGYGDQGGSGQGSGGHGSGGQGYGQGYGGQGYGPGQGGYQPPPGRDGGSGPVGTSRRSGPSRSLWIMIAAGVAVIVAVVVIVALLNSGGGGSGGSGAIPTDASVDDYCQAIQPGVRDDGTVTPQALDGYHEWGEDMRSTGSPSDMPEDARAGFEKKISILTSATAQDLEDPLYFQKVDMRLSPSQVTEKEAWEAYNDDTC